MRGLDADRRRREVGLADRERDDIEPRRPHLPRAGRHLDGGGGLRPAEPGGERGRWCEHGHRRYSSPSQKCLIRSHAFRSDAVSVA